MGIDLLKLSHRFAKLVEDVRKIVEEGLGHAGEGLYFLLGGKLYEAKFAVVFSGRIRAEVGFLVCRVQAAKLLNLCFNTWLIKLQGICKAV